MGLNDQEKILCASYMLKKKAHYWWPSIKSKSDILTMTWEDFKVEFNQKFYNPTAMQAQQTKFLNLKQGDMTMAKAIKKFK